MDLWIRHKRLHERHVAKCYVHCVLHGRNEVRPSKPMTCQQFDLHIRLKKNLMMSARQSKPPLKKAFSIELL
jgi:hypothetical protein